MAEREVAEGCTMCHTTQTTCTQCHMPETFFVDASGIVRGRHAGPLTPAVLAEMLPRIGVAP